MIRPLLSITSAKTRVFVASLLLEIEIGPYLVVHRVRTRSRTMKPGGLRSADCIALSSTPSCSRTVCSNWSESGVYLHHRQRRCITQQFGE